MKSSLRSEKLYKALKLSATYARSRFARSKPSHFILMYHRVIDSGAVSKPEPGTWVDVQTFESQMQFLKRTCDIKPLPEFVESLQSSISPPRPVSAVTFDDGWRDNFTNAFPILERLGVPATIFLVSQCIESGKAPWFEDAWNSLLQLQESDLSKLSLPAELRSSVAQLLQKDGLERDTKASECLGIIKHMSDSLRKETIEHLSRVTGCSGLERVMLDWQEIRTMARCGVDFGVHTRSHAILTQLSDDELNSEIAGAKADIENKLGQKVASFAYPNGDLNGNVLEKIIDAGLDIACTTAQSHCRKSDDRLTLPRIGIHQGFSQGIRSFSPLIFRLRLGIV